MDPFPFAHISGRRPYATGESRDKWLPATRAAAAASRRASCASWCNSSVTTPTSSRSAPASENSTRRRLTGHAHAEHASRRFDENGILVIPSPPDLEKLLPNYYRTAKLASFQRQLNNFGYHRVGWTPARGQAQPQGLKYHKVVGEATTRTESLLELRPLSRRKRERAPAPAPRRRNARAEPLKRARTESDANAAMLLLSCMRREDSLPALGEPIAA